MTEIISITALSSISSLGKTKEDVWKNYLKDKHFLTKKNFQKIQNKSESVFVGSLSEEVVEDIKKIKEEDNKYKNLDHTVLFAIYVSRNAIKEANWKTISNFGVNFGSSRGATSLFEKYHTEFLEQGQSSTLSSPTTTLGNISSWVAHDLQTSGPEISHSITCSTALHSLLNGIAWINSGMTDKFLVGGSEAPLTPFTIAQMQALKVYSKYKLEFAAKSVKKNLNNVFEEYQHLSKYYPCQAFNLKKTKNTMVLGEGAAAICLEKGSKKNALCFITSVGYATEVLKHNTSVSADAVCFQKSMRMALKNKNLNDVDVIVMHAPGTIKGDSSEINAIKKVFNQKIPFLTTNKWKIGHTFGASGLLSLEFAILMLQNEKVIEVPFAQPQTKPEKIKNILVNAVGFGGNAVSILLSKKT